MKPYRMRFYVPASRAELEAADISVPFEVRHVLECSTEEGSFIWQIFQAPGGIESVPRYYLRRGFRLSCDKERELRIYVVAGDVVKLELGDDPHPLDVAVMAYIEALPADHPLIPYGGLDF